MFDVALFEPEIAPNTGNIIRLCANTGARLHLIGTLGFHLDDRALRRAGLDYHERVTTLRHDNFATFRRAIAPRRVLGFSTRGAHSAYEINYRADDCLLFGPETRGFPAEIRHALGANAVLKIPMIKNSRSLNLANAVAIALYEAWRQIGFEATC